MDSTKLSTSESVSKKKCKKAKKKVRSEGEPVVEMETAASEVKEEKSSSGANFPPTFSMSEIKNKQRRHTMFIKLKQEKRKVNSHKHTHVYYSFLLKEIALMVIIGIVTVVVFLGIYVYWRMGTILKPAGILLLPKHHYGGMVFVNN